LEGKGKKRKTMKQWEYPLSFTKENFYYFHPGREAGGKGSSMRGSGKFSFRKNSPLAMRKTKSKGKGEGSRLERKKRGISTSLDASSRKKVSFSERESRKPPQLMRGQIKKKSRTFMQNVKEERELSDLLEGREEKGDAAIWL